MTGRQHSVAADPWDGRSFRITACGDRSSQLGGGSAATSRTGQMADALGQESAGRLSCPTRWCEHRLGSDVPLTGVGPSCLLDRQTFLFGWEGGSGARARRGQELPVERRAWRGRNDRGPARADSSFLRAGSCRFTRRRTESAKDLDWSACMLSTQIGFLQSDTLIAASPCHSLKSRAVRHARSRWPCRPDRHIPIRPRWAAARRDGETVD